MKITIVGTGAMGCIYAALFADAGNEVWAIDAWHAHVNAMNENGLRVEGASGDRTVKVNASLSAADAGVSDLVIIATKAANVLAAAESARSLIGEHTVVLTIQNGLGSADIVGDVLGRERVSIGVAGGFGASMRGPGHAHHNGMQLIRLGQLEGPVNESLKSVAAAWEDAGFHVKTFDNIHQLLWEKLICNVCYSGPCTVTEWTLGEVMADEDAWAMASSAASEAFAVAKKKGVTLGFDDPVAYVREFGEKIPKSKPSMLQDYLANRPGEIDVINGAIVREGRALGMPTPVNDTIVATVKIKEKRAGIRPRGNSAGN